MPRLVIRTANIERHITSESLHPHHFHVCELRPPSIKAINVLQMNNIYMVIQYQVLLSIEANQLSSYQDAGAEETKSAAAERKQS